MAMIYACGAKEAVRYDEEADASSEAMQEIPVAANDRFRQGMGSQENNEAVE
jgi:hypothetical protein